MSEGLTMLCPRCRGTRSARESAAHPVCAVDGAGMVSARALAKSDGDPFLGAHLKGDFLPLELAALGAHSAVYRGTSAHRRDVAIKIMRLDGPSSASVLAAWERETRALRRVSSESITQMVGAGHVSGAEAVFVALAWIDGTTLRDRLAEGSLDVPRAVGVAMSLCRGLKVLHDEHIVHGDLKPHNVMLEQGSVEDRVTLIDLGSAIEIGQISSTVTPLYGAPEQIRGEPVDARTDLYGLGCTLYHLLVGRPPFEGNADAVRRKHLEDLAPALERGPGRLKRLVAELLSKEPHARPPSAADVLDELAAVAGAF